MRFVSKFLAQFIHFPFRIDGLYETDNDMYNATPRNLLVDAVARNDEVGSCTCVIVTLDKVAKVISTVNLGDSGYMILRKDKNS